MGPRADGQGRGGASTTPLGPGRRRTFKRARHSAPGKLAAVNLLPDALDETLNTLDAAFATPRGPGVEVPLARQALTVPAKGPLHPPHMDAAYFRELDTEELVEEDASPSQSPITVRDGSQASAAEEECASCASDGAAVGTPCASDRHPRAGAPRCQVRGGMRALPSRSGAQPSTRARPLARLGRRPHACARLASRGPPTARRSSLCAGLARRLEPPARPGPGSRAAAGARGLTPRLLRGVGAPCFSRGATLPALPARHVLTAGHAGGATRRGGLLPGHACDCTAVGRGPGAARPARAGSAAEARPGRSRPAAKQGARELVWGCESRGSRRSRSPCSERGPPASKAGGAGAKIRCGWNKGGGKRQAAGSRAKAAGGYRAWGGGGVGAAEVGSRPGVGGSVRRLPGRVVGFPPSFRRLPPSLQGPAASSSGPPPSSTASLTTPALSGGGMVEANRAAARHTAPKKQ